MVSTVHSFLCWSRVSSCVFENIEYFSPAIIYRIVTFDPLHQHQQHLVPTLRGRADTWGGGVGGGWLIEQDLDTALTALHWTDWSLHARSYSFIFIRQLTLSSKLLQLISQGVAVRTYELHIMINTINPSSSRFLEQWSLRGCYDIGNILMKRKKNIN